MFYLISYLKTVFSEPLKGIAFSSITLLLFLGIFSKDRINENIAAKVKMKGQESFFYALIEKKENQARIARKLRALPGVKYVETLTSHAINNKANQLVNAVGLGMNSELTNLDYTGLKVVFKSAISSRSIELIRDYLNRLVGEKKLTLGAVKEPRKNQAKISGLLGLANAWGSLIILVSLFIVWLLSFFQFERVIAKRAYLIENFQRREKVGIKILFVGLLLLFTLSVILKITIINAEFSLSSIFLTVAIVILAMSSQLRTFRWDT